MAAPHVTGVAALNRATSELAAVGGRDCAPALGHTDGVPADWQPLADSDERDRCRSGSHGHTSFYGAGLVDATAATRL